jgi:hypothetical protein
MSDPASAIVMSDTLVHGLEAIGSLIGSGLAVVFFWVRLSDRISTADAKADAATKSASTALARVIKTEEELVEHRVKLAEEYASKQMLNDFRGELLGAINRVSDQIMTLFKKDAQ